MCEPATIAYGVLAVLSGVASYQQSSVQAKTQTRMAENNAQAATDSAMQSYVDAQVRQGQVINSASEQIQQRRMQEMRQMGSARAAAAEAGVTGFSVDALINEIAGVSGRDVSAITQNRDWNVGQINREMTGIQAQAEGRANSMAHGTGPSGWASALKIGADAANIFAGSPSAKAPKENTKAPTSTTKGSQKKITQPVWT